MVKKKSKKPLKQTPKQANGKLLNKGKSPDKVPEEPEIHCDEKPAFNYMPSLNLMKKIIAHKLAGKV
jgi:hypothetical protein